MLRICSKQEYKQYVDFVYEIALDPSKSGYPIYSDGIKTKDMFLSRSERVFSRDTEAILLFEYDGIVEGWIHYYVLPEDKYISTVSFNILSHTEEALREFLELIHKQYKDYELYLGYPMDNVKAVNYLSAHGFECIEKNYNTTAYLEKYKPEAADDSVVRITKENYEYFRLLHRSLENDMYWNSERIYMDIEHWIIFVKIKNGEAIGALYYMDAADAWYEIFGIDMKDNRVNGEIYRELLVKALTAAKEMGGKYMTYFCDEEELEIVSGLGFECVGCHVCYKKLII